MRARWNLFGFQLHKVLCIVLMLHLLSDECLALNLDGLALLAFRSRLELDPHGVFANWNPEDEDPCQWSGVYCVENRVEILNLKGLSLRGILAPELGKLSNLRALILYENNFSGAIPRELGGLTMLELLDLRGNNLSGTIPAEIGEMISLKYLLLCNNHFHGGMPSWLGKLNMLSDLQFDRNLSFDVERVVGCINRKFGHCIWESSLQQLKKANSFMMPLKGKLLRFLDALPLFKLGKGASHKQREKQDDNLQGSTAQYAIQNAQHNVNSARRKLLQESSNLPAALVSSGRTQEIVTAPSVGSGSFPAVASPVGTGKPKQLPAPTVTSGPMVPDSPTVDASPLSPEATTAQSAGHQSASTNGSVRRWQYFLVIPGAAILLSIAAGMLCMCRSNGVATIGPWKTGLSGQLQKAFVTGVPKLNRPELEAACEDFSNIIRTYPHCTVFKGTLSSGVEIAVVSSAVASKEWSKHSEMHFRKKIDTLSRVNHKNFVNLLGYCEENEPFVRAMVFEYAPNGTLFEHLHVKELEHLDWSARMRIIMGTAYCLQYLHCELNPHLAHPNLHSNAIYLTDDYAAKIADIGIWKDIAAKRKISGMEEVDISDTPSADPESNVYEFGTLLLEIISGKLPYSEEQGNLVDWAAEYLNDKRSISYMIDPTLKSFKNNELDIICGVIQECIHQDPKKRPNMKEVTAKLRAVIAISPDSATPKLSPLWWAELEILSVEAS